METKDTAFYTAESTSYSGKRYPARASTFTQFFFKERLAQTVQLLTKEIGTARDLSLLEIGSADGVVVNAVWRAFPESFTTIDAVDLAPAMVDAATVAHADTPIRFSVRAPFTRTYDVILEVGVLNYTDLETDLKEVSAALVSGGFYICSLSACSSLQNSLKGAKGYAHLRSYKKYENALRRCFTIEKAVPVGYFIPWLWKIPAFARVTQPVIEIMGRVLAPSVAHEKLYVLRALT